jgi:hypothetical protein
MRISMKKNRGKSYFFIVFLKTLFRRLKSYFLFYIDDYPHRKANTTPQ